MLHSVELYDPATDSWALAEQTISERITAMVPVSTEYYDSHTTRNETLYSYEFDCVEKPSKYHALHIASASRYVALPLQYKT